MDILFIALLIGIVLTIILCSIAYAILKRDSKQSQQKEITINEQQIQTNTKNNKEHSSAMGCLVTIIITFISALIVFGVASIFARPEIKQDDVTIIPKNITLTYIDLLVEPKISINDLEIKMDFYDDNGNKIHSINKNLGNVESHKQYNISILTAELLVSSFTADNIRYTVTGTQSLFTYIFNS